MLFEIEKPSERELPKVLIDGRYYAQVSREARTKTETDYIADCYQSANWLVEPGLNSRLQSRKYQTIGWSSFASC